MAAPKVTFWRAVYESSHFSFEAYGSTEHDARAVLIGTLKRHGKQYGCEPGWYLSEGWSEEDVIYAYPVAIGTGYRDKSPI